MNRKRNVKKRLITITIEQDNYLKSQADKAGICVSAFVRKSIDQSMSGAGWYRDAKVSVIQDFVTGERFQQIIPHKATIEIDAIPAFLKSAKRSKNTDWPPGSGKRRRSSI